MSIPEIAVCRATVRAMMDLATVGNRSGREGNVSKVEDFSVFRRPSAIAKGMGTMGIVELVDSVAALTPPGVASAAAHEAHLDAFIADVDAAILGHPRISEFLGGNPSGLLTMNHRHHGLFLAELLRAGTLVDLPSTSVWAYRAYRARGVHPDYFAAHLPQWPIAFDRHDLGGALCDVTRIYEWLIDQHPTMIELSNEPAQEPPVDEVAQLRFIDALTNLDLSGSVAVVNEALDGGMSLLRVLTELITPGLHTVGVRWENGSFSTADEHRATAIATRIVGELLSRAEVADVSGGKIVVTSVESEFHDLGGLVLAIYFEAAGWDVIYLGANTPNTDVAVMARELEADVVALSVTMPTNLRSARSLIDTVRGHCGAKILVGGGVFQRCPSLGSNIEADHVTNDPIGAVRWATT